MITLTRGNVSSMSYYYSVYPSERWWEPDGRRRRWWVARKVQVQSKDESSSGSNIVASANKICWHCVESCDREGDFLTIRPVIDIDGISVGLEERDKKKKSAMVRWWKEIILFKSVMCLCGCGKVYLWMCIWVHFQRSSKPNRNPVVLHVFIYFSSLWWGDFAELSRIGFFVNLVFIRFSNEHRWF